MPLDDRDLELLSAYLDNALTAEERAGVESRLAADADLRLELERLRLTKNLIGALPTLRPPRPLTVTRAMLTPRVLSFPATVAFSAISAAAAVIVLLAGVVLLSTTQSAPSESLGVAQFPTAAATIISLTATENVQLFAQEEAQLASPPAVATEALNAVPASTLVVATVDIAAASGLAGGEAAAELPAPAPLATLLPYDGVEASAEGAAQDSAADLLAPAMRQAESVTPEPDAAVAQELAPLAAVAATTTPARTLLPPTPSPAPSATLLPTRTPLPTLEPTATPIPAPITAPGDASSVGIALIIIAALLFLLSAAVFIRRNG